MTSVRLDFKDAEIRRWIKHIPRATERATARGINKGMEQVRTEAVRIVQQDRNLLQRVIKEGMRITRATARRLTVTLEARGRPISLRNYKAKVVGKRGRKAKKGNFPDRSRDPVQVEIRKGDKKIVEGAFIGPNGGVFKRAGVNRLPIKKLFGPDLPSALNKPDAVARLRRKAEMVTPRLVEHEMRREFRRAYR